MTNKLFALDASLSNCGYAIFENDKYLLSGQFQPSGSDWIDKIQCIARWLYSLSMKHRFDVLAYEYPSGQHNHDTTLKLGALLYAVQLFARSHQMRFVTVKPSEVKATGIGKGCIDNPYKNFVYPRRNDGTTIQAQLDKIFDELDALGIAVAVLSDKEKLNGELAIKNYNPC